MAHHRGRTIPVVLLAREGAAIPRAALAQSTMGIDWSRLELEVFASQAATARALVCLPSENVLRRTVDLDRSGNGFVVKTDPLAGQVDWTVDLVAGEGGVQ